MSTIQRAIFVLMLAICLCTKLAVTGENQTNTTSMPSSSTSQNEPNTSSMGLTLGKDALENQAGEDYSDLGSGEIHSNETDVPIFSEPSKGNEDEITDPTLATKERPNDESDNHTAKPSTTPVAKGNNNRDDTKDDAPLKDEIDEHTAKPLTTSTDKGNKTREDTKDNITLKVITIAAVVGGTCIVVIIANCLQLVVLLKMFGKGKGNERIPEVTKVNLPKIVVTKDSDERLELSVVELGDNADTSVGNIKSDASDGETPKLEQTDRTNAITSEPDSKVNEPVSAGVTDANTTSEPVNETGIISESVDLEEKHVCFETADNDWPDPPNIDTQLLGIGLDLDCPSAETSIQIDVAKSETSNTKEGDENPLIGSQGNGEDPSVCGIQGVDTEDVKPTEAEENDVQITIL